MTNENEATVQIVAIEAGTSVKGQNIVTLKNGKATFTNTRFYAKPGKTNVKFKLESTAINYKLVQYLDPVKYADQIFTVNFRWCKPGEIQIEDICSTCTTGTYSVKWNQTNCQTCPNNAACEGERISLNSGYWRIDANSTDIMECPNEDACLGGYNPQNKHPVNCAAGYQGLLCNECIIEGETQYERISDNQCSKCPDPTMNLLRIVGWGIAIVIFMMVLIWVNIQKKEDSNISVLMRIMTNYLQIIAAALSYNLQFPTYILDVLSSARQVGQSSGVFLSFDCLLMDTRASEMFDNIANFKTLCIALIPILLIVSSSIGYRLIFIRNTEKFKRFC